MEADIASQAIRLGTNTEFTLMSLFLRADIIVKSVMIILIVCSVYSWAVIIDKFRLFKKINKSSEDFEEKFWNSTVRIQLKLWDMEQKILLNIVRNKEKIFKNIQNEARLIRYNIISKFCEKKNIKFVLTIIRLPINK